MDNRVVYVAPGGATVTLYLPPQFEAPSSFQVREAGDVKVAQRLSDRDLECHQVAGDGQKRCTDMDCHSRVLGDCQCGRHRAPIPFTAVQR